MKKNTLLQKDSMQIEKEAIKYFTRELKKYGVGTHLKSITSNKGIENEK